MPTPMFSCIKESTPPNQVLSAAAQSLGDTFFKAWSSYAEAHFVFLPTIQCWPDGAVVVALDDGRRRRFWIHQEGYVFSVRQEDITEAACR